MSLISQTDIRSPSIVPPIVVLMLSVAPIVKKYSLKSLQSITIGAAPLTKESQSRLKALLPEHTIVNQVWGMTELSCVATVSN
jgi:4-coumarate--CoA ligase